MPLTKPSEEKPMSHIHHPWMQTSHYGRKIMLTLFGILLAYLIFLVGTLIRNNIKTYAYIGRADRLERTITIDGQGKVTAAPDIAVTTMGMIAEAKTVQEAQLKNTTVMNSLVEKLKALGIKSEDIKTTNYNIFPQYNYTDQKGRELTGYEVQQQVTIKIRDLSKANQVLAFAGEVGANSVSGLEFTIDDRDVYKTQARDIAMKKVQEKAESLAKSLGVRLIDVVAYNEYEEGTSSPYMYAKANVMEGFGGAAPAPTIESGSMDVMMNVQVTFEIR